MATLSYGGGWFSDQRTSTGTSSGLNRASSILAATMLVSVGTGAFVDDLTRSQQHRLNYVTGNPLKDRINEIARARTPAEDLERIREVLSPAVSQLADAFSVSRQTVYNWLKKEQPKPEHIAKLRDLAQAADWVVESGVQVTGALLKRKLFEGKNLFEVAHNGGSVRDAAQLLVQIVRAETDQRKMMAARFAGRKSFSRSAESDFPAENDRR